MEGTRSGRPLLAASARPRTGVLLAGCAVLVAVLGVLFARQSTADRFDRAVDAPFVTWFAARHGLALWLAYPGTMVPAIVLSVVIAVACLITRRFRGAVLAVAAVPVAVELCEVLVKPLVHRTYIGQVVYPSGHTAAIFALAATVTVLLFAPPRPAVPRWLRILILAVVYLAAVAVVIGRHRRALPLLHRHGGRRGRRPRHGVRAGPGPRPHPGRTAVPNTTSVRSDVISRERRSASRLARTRSRRSGPRASTVAR